MIIDARSVDRAVADFEKFYRPEFDFLRTFLENDAGIKKRLVTVVVPIVVKQENRRVLDLLRPRPLGLTVYVKMDHFE